MTYRLIPIAFILVLSLSGCHWNLNSHDGDNGGPEPDTTAAFKDVTSSNLPEEAAATYNAAKAADIDSDGDLDLVIAVQSAPNRILINDGTGTFIDESDDRLPAQNYDSQDLAVADLNSDGNLDLFFVSNQNQTNELYINNGSGVFSDLSNRIPVEGNSTSVVATDVDGDGPTDLLIGNLGQNNLLINSGNAFFNDQTLQRMPQINDPTRDLAFGDLTGDNRSDIVAGNENANRLLVNTGSGFFADRTSDRVPFSGKIEETEDVNLVDVENDGDLDLYFGNTGFQDGSNPQDRLLVNTGGGYYADVTADRLPAITSFTFDADFADLDGDGDADLVVGNYDGGIRVFINNGNGFFTDKTNAWIPENFAPYVRDLEIADFNNDGWLDIFVAVDNSTNKLLLQRNQ